MAAAPEGLARYGGVGGFDRRIVDAEGRAGASAAHRRAAPRRASSREKARPFSKIRKRGGGLAWGGALDLAPGRGQIRASGR